MNKTTLLTFLAINWMAIGAAILVIVIRAFMG
jgi:hypothetical protein